MFITKNNTVEYNISDEIAQYAKVKNLDFIGTGGGYDYVFKKLKNGQEIILGLPNDVDGNVTEGSPSSLSEKCRIYIYENGMLSGGFEQSNGDDYTETSFDVINAKTAMNIMLEMK
jgi:hypothetical protein